MPLNYRKQGGPQYMASMAGDYLNNSGFMSLHPMGAQFAYADGHISFVSETIAIEAYRAQGTISGGEVVAAP